MTEDNRQPLSLLGLGFRPFYLFAALFAVIGMLLWVVTFHGTSVQSAYLSGLVWHSHEMLFGFVAAVMAGFLLTAVRNWTGLPTPTGKPLAVLALLWLAGRLLAFTGPGSVAAFIDILFLPCIATVVAIPILKSRNKRNYKILVILVALTLANVTFHCSIAGLIPPSVERIAMSFATHTMLLLLAIIGGRVIPAFTANAVQDSRPRHIYPLEVVAMGSLLLVLASDVMTYWFVLPQNILGALFLLAAVAHTIRLLLWQPSETLHISLLWMLPASYAWIPLSLLLAALAAAQVVSPVAATHAMTAGAMSCMMMAMMMRSSLGHSGRALSASRLDIGAYLLLQVAVICRVAATVMSPALYGKLVAVSGLAWILAFSLFLVHYGPILTRPRVDGRPG